ncbi:MAG: lipopolysaccharide assembly protein LapB [Gammaproteobacteria bacterium]|nr:lipopolysaccharide assembly protein LapB [Gammaproteobacteria bacterium]MCP5316747.1 lipopolysaccharide assembly protein LapB [Chromatiaceae bacterium]MCW5585546.1 lipopolysaccharide assembly protein LapB [Chromatiales bacterium]MCB1817343.1 lipopolysaccharide assembly protein LapB [Gammaproteobacteria bacterium]MCP5428958.1 lipopolysaccharide assembly protein LapB [Chromatiaceae bacterium]
MQELLLLLLPVAAASGWLAARRSARKEKGECVGETGPVYFRGLNHLLNEEPDKAIDAFVEMLEVDSDTVETHLALGNLFRRRGEVERAIRIHQNLIARPALTREQRAQALLELGQDYMRAGLFDRAENLFRELKDTKLHVRAALKNLLTIYEKERDWQASLEVADQLESLTGERMVLQKSHYHCELALAAKAQGRVSEAQVQLKKALGVDRGCVRANHLQAQFAAVQGDYRGAIRILKQTVEEDADYLPEVLPEMLVNYRHLGELQELRGYLQEISAAQPGAGAELALAELLKEVEGESAAAVYLAAQLARKPSLTLLLRSIEMNARMPESQSVNFLDSLRPHIRRLLDQQPMYQCGHCGFSAKMLHWQCPSCRRWSTIKRKAGCEAEL